MPRPAGRRRHPPKPENLFSGNKKPPKRDMSRPAGRRKHPRKRQNLFSGNKKPPKRDMSRPAGRRRHPRKRQNLFSGNKKPPKRDMRTPCAPYLRPFLNHGHKFSKMIFKFTRPYMLSQITVKKSSAIYLVTRVFAQKGFAISIFGHFFCPFSENFIESCRVKTKNNNFILQ